MQLEACIAGRGSHHSLVSVWEELKAAIRAWLDIRDRPDAAALPPAATLQLHSASAARAVAAMQAAACSEAAMLQASRPLLGDGTGVVGLTGPSS